MDITISSNGKKVVGGQRKITVEWKMHKEHKRDTDTENNKKSDKVASVLLFFFVVFRSGTLENTTTTHR